jgi:hypothetical protein
MTKTVKFSEVKIGKAFAQYDDYDGERIYVKTSETEAACAFDYFYDYMDVGFRYEFEADEDCTLVTKKYAKAWTIV